MLKIRRFAKLLVLFSLMSYSMVSTGQDLVFSQYFKSPLLLNPGFAGISPYPYISLNYRNQWPSLDNAYTTYAASYNQYFDRAKSGLGVQLVQDNQADGILSTSKIGVTYAYNLDFTSGYSLKLGIGVEFNQQRLQWDKLIFGDQIDLINGPDASRISTETRPSQLSTGYGNINTGFLFFNEQWYIGFAMFNLNKPTTSFGLAQNDSNRGIPLRYSLHTGYQIVLSDNKKYGATFFQPTALVTNQTGFWQANVGLTYGIDVFEAGLFLRTTETNRDAVIAMIGYNIGFVDVTYSYDINISELNNSGGSHEIGVIFDLKTKYPPKSKLNDCLKLFK